MKAVIFDMDGVMIDSERVCMKMWDKVGVEMGVGKAGYMIYKTLGMNVNASVKILKEEFGEDFDALKFRNLSREYSFDYYEKNGVPIKEGLYELLDNLKTQGYSLAVASSTSKQSVYHRLSAINVTEYFDAVICGDMIAHSKPNPDIYLTAAKALNTVGEECYAIEDSKSGIESAHAAKCKVIMVPDLWQGDDEHDKLLYAKCQNLIEVNNSIFAYDKITKPTDN